MQIKNPNLPQWKQILRQNFTDPNKLADFLLLSSQQRETILSRPRFILNLPLRLANKIVKGDMEDPILKQFLPTTHESHSSNGFVNDPVGDSECRIGRKLLHKYNGRVLLVTTSSCAMHCRYCFRQKFDYEVEQNGFADELQLISQDESINEVILSGGDPLSLDDRVLENLLNHLSNIPHIRKIRFHTRFPIGIPERIDESFLSLLSRVPKQIWFVIHVNHPHELDPDILASLKSIQRLGIPVLNQSVLLKGINDNAETLIQLCSTLVDHGIFPYYLHQLDRVQGTAHFEVDEACGKELIQTISTQLPGYAVPKFVREIPGMPSKTPQ